MNNKKQNLSILLLAILSIYVFASILANVDLVSGRYELFMDERITFDGVRKIIHPESVKKFLWEVTNGGDQRYGRVLWNSMALFSYLPEKIFGESGQIIASRMLQTLLILFTYLILAFGLLNSWSSRIILALVLFTMPYVAYYSTMPKPEPMQLLFLALFFLYYFKNDGKFGWFYIFIGIAFGAKISTLFILSPLLILSLYKSIRAVNNRDESILIGIFSFLIGLGISVPILFIPIAYFILSCSLYRYISYCIKINNKINIVIILLLLLLVIFFNNEVIKIWLNATFLNTTHGADRSSINAWSWAKYFINVWMIAPNSIAIAFIISIIIFLIFYVYRILFYNNREINNKKITAFFILISGVTLNFGIFITAHRLWGFYLYPGMLVIFFGLILIFDVTSPDNSLVAKSNNVDSKLSTFTNYLRYFILALLTLLSLFFWGPNTYNTFNELQNRTTSKDYLLNKDSYSMTIKILSDLSLKKGRQVLVMYSPSVFFAESNSKFYTEEFWGPYLRWKEGFDAIVLHIDNTPQGEAYSRESPIYNDYLIEQQGYRDHVVFELNSVCKVQPCFYSSARLPNGSEILIKIAD
jgi:hypothetical protein